MCMFPVVPMFFDLVLISAWLTRYTEMTNAVSLRGDVLDMLGESLNNVSMSATQYLGQAKNTAVRLQIFRYVRLDPENPYTDCHISVDERDGEGRGEGYIRQIVVTNFNKSCKCRVIFDYLYLVIRLCWSSYPLPFYVRIIHDYE